MEKMGHWLLYAKNNDYMLANTLPNADWHQRLFLPLDNKNNNEPIKRPLTRTTQVRQYQKNTHSLNPYLCKEISY